MRPSRFYSRFYPGINMRITAPFLLVVLVVAGIGIFIVTRLVSGSIQERLDNQLIDSAQASSNTVTEVERGLLENLRLMVFTRTIDEVIAEGDTDQLAELLQPIAVNALTDDVIVFDAEGKGLLQLKRREDLEEIRYTSRTPSDEITEWASVQSIIRLDHDHLGDKFVEIIDIEGKPYLYLAAAVTNDQGQVVGGISIGIGMQRLARQISNQSLAAVVLYDQQGRVLGNAFRSVSNEALIMTPEQAADLNRRVQDEAPIQEITYTEVPYKVLYAPFKLRSSQIGIIAVALPSSFVSDRIGTSRDLFAALFSGLFLAVALMGVLVARSISEPVRRLVSTTRAIREGDLSQRVGLRMPDELGELSVSFDHMTEKLIERNKEISSLYLAQIQQTAQRDAILTNIADAVVVLDAEYKLFLYNHAAYHLMNALSQDTEKYQVFWQICYAPQQYFEPQTVTIEPHYYSVSAASVQLESGSHLGYVIVFRDITAIIEAERLKNELILQLSHELRTPLTAVMGYFNLIQVFSQRFPDPQMQGFMGNMGKKLDVLHRMIDQVVDVNTMITGRFFIQPHLFDFTAALDELLDEHEPLIEAAKLRLSLRMPAADLWIEADQKRLLQAIAAVLQNAYSYTLPGGDVQMVVYTQDSCTFIQIDDSGVGIAPDEIPKVFNLMYRGRSADAGPTDVRGMGLGLYIAQQIIQKHHGSITIKSTLHLGTTVTMQVPIQQEKRA